MTDMLSFYGIFSPLSNFMFYPQIKLTRPSDLNPPPSIFYLDSISMLALFLSYVKICPVTIFLAQKNSQV